jgi:hypothetical protein
MRGEVLSTDSSDVRKLIDDDNLEDDLRGDEFRICEENQEILARKDRNFLVKHKEYEQIVEEDPANRKIWGEDESGNKVLLQDQEGKYVDQPPIAEEEPAEAEEEEIDTMQGLKDLTKGIRDLAEKD